METAPKTCCEGLHFTPFSTLSTSGVPFPSHVQKNCTLTVPCSVLELVRLKFVSSFEFFWQKLQKKFCLQLEIIPFLFGSGNICFLSTGPLSHKSNLFPGCERLLCCSEANVLPSETCVYAGKQTAACISTASAWRETTQGQNKARFGSKKHRTQHVPLISARWRFYRWWTRLHGPNPCAQWECCSWTGPPKLAKRTYSSTLAQFSLAHLKFCIFCLAIYFGLRFGLRLKSACHCHALAQTCSPELRWPLDGLVAPWP